MMAIPAEGDGEYGMSGGGDKCCTQCNLHKEIRGFPLYKGKYRGDKCKQCLAEKNPRIDSKRKNADVYSLACRVCKIEKPIEDFMMTKSGLRHPYCIHCNAYSKRIAKETKPSRVRRIPIQEYQPIRAMGDMVMPTNDTMPIVNPMLRKPGNKT